MAMTGYYRTLRRPRAHRPLSMMKYDPVGRFRETLPFFLVHSTRTTGEEEEDGEREKEREQKKLTFGAVRKQVLFLEQKRGGK